MHDNNRVSHDAQVSHAHVQEAAAGRAGERGRLSLHTAAPLAVAPCPGLHLPQCHNTVQDLLATAPAFQAIGHKGAGLCIFLPKPGLEQGGFKDTTLNY